MIKLSDLNEEVVTFEKMAEADGIDVDQLTVEEADALYAEYRDEAEKVATVDEYLESDLFDEDAEAMIALAREDFAKEAGINAWTAKNTPTFRKILSHKKPLTTQIAAYPGKTKKAIAKALKSRKNMKMVKNQSKWHGYTGFQTEAGSARKYRKARNAALRRVGTMAGVGAGAAGAAGAGGYAAAKALRKQSALEADMDEIRGTVMAHVYAEELDKLADLGVGGGAGIGTGLGAVLGTLHGAAEGAMLGKKTSAKSILLNAAAGAAAGAASGAMLGTGAGLISKSIDAKAAKQASLILEANGLNPEDYTYDTSKVAAVDTEELTQDAIDARTDEILAECGFEVE